MDKWFGIFVCWDLSAFFKFSCRYFRFLNQMKSITNMVVLVTMTPWTISTCLSLFLIAKVNAMKLKFHLCSIILSYLFLHNSFQYTGRNYLYDLQMPVIAIAIVMSLSFMYFFVGQMYHSQAMAFSDDVYEVEWYRYPRGVSRFLPLMIQRSQRPFFLGAFGVMTLNLENFVVVNKLNTGWHISHSLIGSNYFSCSNGFIRRSCYWRVSSDWLTFLMK